MSEQLDSNKRFRANSLWIEEEFDEIVAGPLHIEMMDHRELWIGLGGASINIGWSEDGVLLHCLVQPNR